MIRRLLALLLAGLLPLGIGISTLAQEAAPSAQDPVVEKRLNKISEELRCLVCQNESLAASRADLAVDLRREVRARIAKGDSDDDIRGFLVARYGDFILYRPPLKATTLLLWLGPLLLAIAGFIVLMVHLRRRTRAVAGGAGAAGDLSAEDAALSNEERTKLNTLLGNDKASQA